MSSGTKISALTALLGADVAGADIIPVVDSSAGVTKGLTFTELQAWLESIFGEHENGSFTPIVSDHQTSGNDATGSFYGHYARKGRAVFVQVTLQGIDTTGMTGGNDLYIRNLPFTSEHLAGSNHFVSAVNGRDITFSGILTLDMLDQTDYLRIQETISGSAQDFVRVSEISSGVTNVFATFYYFTGD
jgi:hypothetical protein